MESTNQSVDLSVETEVPFESLFSEKDLTLLSEKEKLFESITSDFSADQGKVRIITLTLY